ncbi:hypothetical protein [Streptomyces sulphureus]|uniref:hypothetical protein n=1 Tax=Streptomyces sulphureus TaxID=47758 RepID=UPI000374B8B9|nr:hypothetical protein [Streptomyces sulphureus]
MFWEALGSALLGAAVACAALRRFPTHLPQPALVLATGGVSGLIGGLITRIVLGSGHTPSVLVAALGVCAALLSLLLSDGESGRRPRRPAQRQPLRQPGPAQPSASYGPR